MLTGRVASLFERTFGGVATLTLEIELFAFTPAEFAYRTNIL
jgi:hypothetical protein